MDKSVPQSIVIVKYRAIKYDNHQGGSGMPFEDKIVFTVDCSMSLAGLEAKTNQALDWIEGECETTYIGMVDKISIEIT